MPQPYSGSYAVARKRPPLLAWAGWVVAALLAALIVLRPTPGDEPDPEPPAPSAAESAPARMPAAEAEAPARRAAAMLAEAEARMAASRTADLEGQLRAARDGWSTAARAAEEYRSGLERCVAELNVQRRLAATAPAAGRRSSPSRSAVSAWEPTAVRTMSGWEITGKVHNAGSDPATGWVYLDLTCGGRTVGESREAMSLDGGELRSYEISLSSAVPDTGPCAATATWATR